MRRMILKKLQINRNLSIEFNEKVNYIVGDNGSGKSTLFHLIQFILGLRVSPSRLSYFNSIDAPQLVCQFGDELVKISRELDSSMVVFEGAIKIKARANSLELNEVYSKLLDISFLYNYNDRSTLDILGFSFFSGLEFKKNNSERYEIYYKILGYNPEFLNAIESDIKKFESQIYLENQSIEIVEKYKERVEASLENLQLTNSSDTVVELLNSEFYKIKERLLLNYELLQNAQNAYKHEKLLSEKYMDEKLASIEPFFYETFKRMKYVNNYDSINNLKSLINKKSLSNMSFGERNLVMFVLRLTFCRELSDLSNGLGLLVTDDIFSMNDSYSTKEIYEKLYNVSDLGEIQYIGFSSPTNNIIKEHIVLDMSQWQGGGLFGK